MDISVNVLEFHGICSNKFKVILWDLRRKSVINYYLNIKVKVEI